MNTLSYILISTLLVSLVSFVGALMLYLSGRVLNKILITLVSLSAGALLGDAFFHLIPESLELVGFDENRILFSFLYLVLGFCVFFVLEQFIHWHHHHHDSHPEIHPFSYLILLSDGVHNFIDGLIIAASFGANVSVGIATTLAVILHEVPQELGDFVSLLYAHFKKERALLLNFLSAVVAVLGGIIGFLVLEKVESSIAVLLPIAAGSFIYIAASDLIPEIKEKTKVPFINFIVFLLGIGALLSLRLLFE